MKLQIKIIFLVLLFSFHGIAANKKSKEELRGEELEFGKIKQVLKNDFLKERADKKVKELNIIKKKRIVDNTRLFNYPREEDVWKILTEIWLVKNASKLKWDFEKPDYGLRASIERLFEQFGFLEQKFRLLLVNSPEVTHFCLPFSRDEVIFVLSVPFIRTLDLTKREIAILLLEDLIRKNQGYFQQYVISSDLRKLLGKNFKGKTVNTTEFDKSLKNMDFFVYSKGFNFQQQYKVTTSMSTILKSNLEYWNNYLTLLQKIDRLVKTNVLYKKYTSLFPSPELQMKWILPKKKVL